MPNTYRSRLAQINRVVFDQVDLFQSDFFNRIVGLTPADVGLTLFLNNQSVPWPLVDGTSVTDAQVVSGSVYWSEMPNGSYSVRFFPNSLGHWTLVFEFAPIPQIFSIDYDIVNLANPDDSGFKVNFCT